MPERKDGKPRQYAPAKERVSVRLPKELIARKPDELSMTQWIQQALEKEPTK